MIIHAIMPDTVNVKRSPSRMSASTFNEKDLVGLREGFRPRSASMGHSFVLALYWKCRVADVERWWNRTHA